MLSQEELLNTASDIIERIEHIYVSQRYRNVILPAVFLRRCDCMFSAPGQGLREFIMQSDNVYERLITFIQCLPPKVDDILRNFDFFTVIRDLEKRNVLHAILSSIVRLDLSPENVNNDEMVQAFMHLVARFSDREQDFGEFSTPPDLANLMIRLLFGGTEVLFNKGKKYQLLDPFCGTASLLMNAQLFVKKHHPTIDFHTYGQEINPRIVGISSAIMLMSGDLEGRIECDDTLLHDAFEDKKFDFVVANPPFGLAWDRQRSSVYEEYNKDDKGSRFFAGLPKVTDATLLIVQHMVHKMNECGRMAVVTAGSALFAGGSGSGESDVRRWIIQNDYLEAVIALPENLFYSKPVGGFIWIISNHKPVDKKGFIQLIDARSFGASMEKKGNKTISLGEQEVRERILQLYSDFKEGEHCKIVSSSHLGTVRVKVERPLRLSYQMNLEDKKRFLNAVPHLLELVQLIDGVLGREVYHNWNEVAEKILAIMKEHGLTWKVEDQRLFRAVFTWKDPAAVTVNKPDGSIEADPDLREYENIPLHYNYEAYFDSEVRAYVKDAWYVNEEKYNYEINFNKYFAKQPANRDIGDIDRELRRIQNKILGYLNKIIK